MTRRHHALPLGLLLALPSLVVAGPWLAARRQRIPGAPGARVERVVYESGGCEVVAYLARPEAPGPHPVLLDLRGGTASRLTLRRRRLAAWAARGPYLVAAPQYRGHDGSRCVDELGGRDVDDVLALASRLEELPDADVGRLFVLGISRGGAMGALALGRGLEAQAAALVSAPADPARLYPRLGPARRRRLRQATGGTPAEVPGAYARRSPLEVAARVHTPVLLLHGGRDHLVPPAHSRWLAAALEAGGAEVRLEVLPRAGHGLFGSHDRERVEAVEAWFRAHDPGRAAAP